MDLRELLICLLSFVLPFRGRADEGSTEYACEGSTLHLQCSGGSTISLKRANYGRFSITICNDQGNTDLETNCMSTNTLGILRQKCDSKSVCEVLATSEVFGNPCPNTFKYLEIQYKCNATSHDRPSWPPMNQLSDWRTAPVSKGVEEPAATPSEGAASTAASRFPDEDASEVARPTSPLLRPGGTPAGDGGFADLGWDGKPARELVADDDDPAAGHRHHHLHRAVACPPELMRGVMWAWAMPGEEEVQQCPGGANGRAKWACVSGKLRSPSPDLSECKSALLASLEARLEGGYPVVTLAVELAQVVLSKPLYGGDLIAAAHLLHQLPLALRRTSSVPVDLEVVRELVQASVKVGSNLLSLSREPPVDSPWTDLPPEALRKWATLFLSGLEENGFLFARAAGSDIHFGQREPELAMIVGCIRANNSRPPLVLPSRADLLHLPDLPDFRATIPASSTRPDPEDLVHIVVFAFNRLETLLSPRALQEDGGCVINSHVITVSTGRNRHVQLTQPAILTFGHLDVRNFTDPECMIWDFVTHKWSREGCQLLVTNSTHTTCTCDYLTTFALKMCHKTRAELLSRPALHKEVVASCVVASLFLAAALLLANVLDRPLGEARKVRAHLCCCLLLTQLVLLLVVVLHPQSAVHFCVALAIMLHFFLVAVFAWAFCDCFQLYLGLTESYPREGSRMIWYCCLAYVGAAVVVAVSCMVDVRSYGRGGAFCWFPAHSLSVLSVVGPSGSLILASFVVLAMGLHLVRSQSDVLTGIKEHQHLQRAQWDIAGAGLLLGALVATVVLALLHLQSRGSVISASLAASNCLLGVVALLSVCMQCEQLYKWLGSCISFVACHSQQRKDSQSSFYVTSPSDLGPWSCAPHGRPCREDSYRCHVPPVFYPATVHLPSRHTCPPTSFTCPLHSGNLWFRTEPVYEEIDSRSPADCSDISRQSSRSYSDSRPLISDGYLLRSLTAL